MKISMTDHRNQVNAYFATSAASAFYEQYQQPDPAPYTAIPTRLYVLDNRDRLDPNVAYSSTTTAALYHQQNLRETAAHSLNTTTPNRYDVVCGRGQGVQRQIGNTKYRALVKLNKVLYAKCPKKDKAKIAKGIVAAVRHFGGRFLELDERTGVYCDIGDKKAHSKTSQALREGQTKIREQLIRGMNSSVEQQSRTVSSEGYFMYSVELLDSLHRDEEEPHSLLMRPPAA